MRAVRTGRPGRLGQSMVEFALVAPVMFLFIFGIIDFGRYYTANVNVEQASRAGVRFAVTHPYSWDNGSAPASGTIQSAIIAASPEQPIANNDTQISITYWDVVSTGSAVECGYYTQASAQFVAVNGYVESNCLIPGSIVKVTVSVPFAMVTPLMNDLVASNLTITHTTQLVEEQGCPLTGGVYTCP